MRRRGRTDGNQTEIVKALRKLGATARVTSDLGDGFPDVVVGFQGRTILLEVKDGELPPSHRKLTPAETRFVESWRGGPVVVVASVDEALAAILPTQRTSGTPVTSLPPQNANTGGVRLRVIG